ncbi:hypothetical protein [Kitasatospora purpeofusca]|uniref:hypothetical protein n=1 Tax=Kitasatospora purpeofusca TaxID=67352 RepID=UPI00364E7221
MDAADLDRRARTLSGCIPPALVALLLGRGHEREVESQASQGEWFCARAWARLLGERGRREDALEVLAPYVATGWWPAARLQAELLESWGRVREAIELVRPYAATGGQPLEFLARLLARHGRGDEAIEVMRAHADTCPGEDSVLHPLAALCLDRGRPHDGLAHLDDLKAERGGEEEWDLFWIRLPLVAAGAGVDEAVGQARAHPEGDTAYAAEHIARMLHDAGRTEEAVVLLDRHLPANRSDLAGYLIGLGRIHDAVALLQEHDHRPPARWSPWSSEPPF